MKREDKFFKKTKCDRCEKPLSVRTMSWFNEETICMDCCDKEKILLKNLRELGDATSYEGCGFIPALS